MSYKVKIIKEGLMKSVDAINDDDVKKYLKNTENNTLKVW